MAMAADADAAAAKAAAKVPKPVVAPKPATPTPLPRRDAPAMDVSSAVGLPGDPATTAATAIQSREGVEKDPLKTETVWSPPAAVRGLISGAAKGALGDTKLTRAVEAARVVAEEIPSPVEALALGANNFGDWVGAPVQFTKGVTGPTVPQRLARVKEVVQAVPKAKPAIMDVDHAIRTQDEAMAGSRKERAAAGLAGGVGENFVQAAQNVGVDLTNLARGIIDLGTTVFASQEVYQGVTAGDIGHRAGEDMGKAMPGQVLDLARGILDGEQNSFATKPFTTWMILIDPALKVGGVAKAGAAGQAVANSAPVVKVRQMYANTVARPLISKMVDNVLVDTAGDVRAFVKRTLEDGVIQRDPRMTALLDKLLYGSQAAGDAVLNMAKTAARQIEQGRARPAVTPELQPARMSIIPEGAAGEVARAERHARNLQAVAGSLGGVSDAAAAAKAAAANLGKGVRSTGRAAERAEGKIARAAQGAEAARAAGEGKVAARQGAVESSVFDLGDTAMSVSERLASTPIGKVAKAEVAASKAAKNFERAQTEYINAAREAKVNPSEFANEYTKLSAEEVGKVAEKLAAKQVDAFPTTEAAAVAKESAAMGKRGVRETYAKLKSFERARDALAKETARAVESVYREGGKAAEAGIDLAERAKQLDADPTKGMTSEVAQLAGKQARKYGRQADAAALEAAEAGIRPEVNLGEVYLPGFKQTGRGRLALGEAERGVQAPVLSMEETFPNVAEGRRTAIVQAAEDASAKKAAALEALGDVDLNGVAVDRNVAAGLRSQADLYQAAREQAQRLNSRNVSDLPAVLTESIRQLVDRQAVDPKIGKVIDRAAPQIADWLYAEIVAENQAKTMSVPFGRIERPVPETTLMEVGPKGRVIERPAYERALEDRNAAGTLDRDNAAGVRASDELALAQSVKLTPEAPKPYQSTSPEFNRASADIADTMRESGYFPSERVPGVNLSEKSISLDGSPASLADFLEQGDVAVKRLSGERIGQRMVEMLEKDTTQLVRSRAVRGEMLREIKRRAEAAGIPMLDRMRLIRDFNEQLVKPERAGATSKSRFVELEHNGVKLWTRQDWSTILDKLPPERLAKVRADALRDVAEEMGAAVQARASVLGLYEEINRFRKDASGAINKETLGDHSSYAKEVARRVLGEGELQPMLMPFNAAKVADALRVNAGKWAVDLNLPGAAILKLADKLGKYENAGKVGGLSDTFSSYYKGVFHDTTPTPEFKNIAVNPGARSSLQSHYAMLQATDTLGAAPSMIRELSQRMKAGAVAMNLRSLVNNNISNTVTQFIRRGDVGILARIPETLNTWKAVMDGNAAHVAPAVRQMYEALQRENIVNGNQVARDIGKSRLMATLEKSSPGTAATVRGIGSAVETGPRGVRVAGEAAGLVPRFQDALARWYTDFGDTPFRIEESVHAYKDAMGKVQKLQAGEWVDLPIGRERYVRVERTADGVQLKDMSGPRAQVMDVPLDSPQLSKVLAKTANTLQERVFFDYSRLGNWGKTLRGGPAAILSGIFSWFFKAADIPGVKKGLVSEMMSHPYNYRTNSLAVKVQQAAESAQRALRRGTMEAAGNAMLTDERQLDALARAYGFNRTTASAIFDSVADLMPAVALNPLNVVYRSVEPLMMAGPTQIFMGGIEAIADRLAYGDIYDNPEALTKVLDVDVTSLPAGEQRRAAMVQDHVRRVLRNEQFNPKQFLTIIGLSGGPLLGTLQKLQAAEAGGKPFTTKDGIAELARLTFGATPSAALDIAGSVLGELGWDAARQWGGYGKDQARQGFSAGTMKANLEGLTAYGIRQIVGLGQLNQYGGLDSAASEATKKARYGRLDAALDMAEKALQQSLVKPAYDRAEQLYIVSSRDPANPEKKKAYDDAVELMNTSKNVLRNEIRKYKATLKDQFDDWQKRRK
jgi:hypothetical protein